MKTYQKNALAMLVSTVIGLALTPVFAGDDGGKSRGSSNSESSRSESSHSENGARSSSSGSTSGSVSSRRSDDSVKIETETETETETHSHPSDDSAGHASGADDPNELLRRRAAASASTAK